MVRLELWDGKEGEKHIWFFPYAAGFSEHSLKGSLEKGKKASIRFCMEPYRSSSGLYLDPGFCGQVFIKQVQ